MSNRVNQTNPSNSGLSNTEVIDGTLARNAHNVSIMLLIVAVPSIALFTYYGLLVNAWQILTISAIMFVASFGALAALFLIPRGRSSLAMMIVITNFTITFISIPFFVQGLGIVLALSIFILTVAIAGLAMPTKYATPGLTL